MEGNWLSIIPPLTTIVNAIFTKRIISSLLFGLIVGSILKAGSLFTGIFKAVEYLMGVLNSADNILVVLFLFSFGSLTEIFKMSGGIKGFARLAEKYVKTEKGALLSVWAVTPVTYLDCCFHTISSGTIAKPLIEKVNGSPERLALVVNVTSSQLIVLIPLATTYVGYIIGITGSAMREAGIPGSPYALFLESIPYNFYSWGMVILSLLVTLFGLGFGKIRVKWGKPDQEGVHGMDEAHEQCKFEEKAPPKVWNLLLPLLVLVILVILLFWYTGYTPGRSFVQALMHAQFEKSLFIATFGTLLLTAVFYLLQRIPLSEIDSHFLSGGTEMLPPIVVLVISWALAAVTRDLGFQKFIMGAFGTGFPKLFIPVMVFIIGALTSYFIGSSWATWALIMPLGLPLAVNSGASIPLVMGAILAGGSVGDSVSFLGETPILTAAITELPLLDHIQTTLPYAGIIAGLAAILFIVSQLMIG
ncbi:MAG TPA: Na+/H+ antiporter NhaC family protein [Bacillota bacterium]